MERKADARDLGVGVRGLARIYRLKRAVSLKFRPGRGTNSSRGRRPEE